MTIKKPNHDQTAFINGASSIPNSYQPLKDQPIEKERTVQCSLRMPKSNHLLLKSLAHKTGTTFNSLINMVLKNYIDESI